MNNVKVKILLSWGTPSPRLQESRGSGLFPATPSSGGRRRPPTPPASASALQERSLAPFALLWSLCGFYKWGGGDLIRRLPESVAGVLGSWACSARRKRLPQASTTLTWEGDPENAAKFAAVGGQGGAPPYQIEVAF